MSETKKQVRHALSTADNPFDYFTEHDDWLNFDKRNGYNCDSHLARVAHISDSFSDEDIEAELERAIDFIVKMNLSGNFIKVSRVVD